MNKKISLIMIFILLTVLLFLSLFLYKIIVLDSTKNNVNVEKVESTTTLLPVGNLLFNIRQNKSGYFLEFKTQDKYSCAILEYDFSADETQGVLNLSLKNIIKQKVCEELEKNIENSQKIPSAKNWILDVKYADKNLKYNINFENSSFSISGSDNIENQSHFENQSYVTIPENIAKITIDYMDKTSEKEIDNILSKLNVSQKETKIDETTLAFKDLKLDSFESTAKFSINKYFSFEDEEIFKTIVSQYKNKDCYISDPVAKNCISINIKTSSGHRYCTWLNVRY